MPAPAPPPSSAATADQAARGNNLAHDLPALQNLAKRDPPSYEADVLVQLAHFRHVLALIDAGAAPAADLDATVLFLASVAHCYRSHFAGLPALLIALISRDDCPIRGSLLRAIVQALLLLRNKELVATQTLLPVLFGLFRIPDKQLRAALFGHIVGDIKAQNRKCKNAKLNRSLQNYLQIAIKDDNPILSKKALDVLIELYKRNVWNDTKTVNIIAEACLAPSSKLVATALHFFLGVDTPDNESSSDDDGDAPDINALKHTALINKKTKSRKQSMKKALSSIKRKERAKSRQGPTNFSAITLLHDPQSFAEKLFTRLRASTSQTSLPFPTRLMLINLLSRLINTHELLVLNLYPFLIKYIKPAQRDVTSILAYTAQATHALLPPDVIEPVVRAIADNFVWSNCANEVVVAGLNTLREIVRRCPLAMPEELANSLIVDFKRAKDKGVVMAARSLLGLYREINPEALAKKDRGKKATMAILANTQSRQRRYGEAEVATTIEGLDLLAAYEKRKARAITGDIDQDDDEDEENSASDDDDDDEEEEVNLISDDQEQDDVSLEELSEEELSDAASEASSAPALVAPAADMATEKILTDDDFRRIRKLKLQRALRGEAGDKADEQEDDDDNLYDESDSNSTNSDAESDDARATQFIEPASLLAGVKRAHDYESRMATVMSGREDREKYGSRKGKRQKGQSLTNEKKAKGKNFMMVLQKRDVRMKSRRGIKEKMKILKNHGKQQGGKRRKR